VVHSGPRLSAGDKAKILKGVGHAWRLAAKYNIEFNCTTLVDWC
jgi:hypothetical protein